jgi:hypothetical protein
MMPPTLDRGNAIASDLRTLRATGYAFGAARVDVQTDSADAGRWLDEFLTPWVTATPPGSTDIVIRFDSSPGACAALQRQRASATPRPLPCFALDRHVVTLPGWRDDDAIIAADDEIGCGYRLTRRRIDVIAPRVSPRARIGLMRVVRERLTSTRASVEACLDLHAAAFAIKGRAVIVAGARRAGKTSVLCHALASGAGLIANDRVFVCVGDADMMTAEGVPTLVSIRPGTLSTFPTLRLAADERPALRHSAEDFGADGPASGRDFSLSPRQLAARLGATCVARAPVSVVVFPEIVDDESAWTIDTASANDVAARLAACIYGSGHSTVRTVFAGVGHEPPPADHPAPDRLARLAATTRVVRLRLGRRAYDEPADAWLRALEVD